MTTDTILVTAAVLAALAWFGARTWRRAKAKYQGGPCCGGGCGCAAPVVFGAKKKKK